MFCEKCKSELRENAKYCDNCGAPVNNPVFDRTSEMAELTRKYKQEFKNAKKLIRIRRLKRFSTGMFISLLCLALFFICKSIDSSAFWCSTGYWFGLFGAGAFALAAIYSLFSNRPSDDRMLDQINQAYENAKMLK